ncbi:ADP-forming succinate--CoA ligase subunit beta [Desulfuribacillus alkaliarsenatis]|uniref:Succinate--CoA ligase [ADP-forming] subunit beta n=1 Tax=Desulfuribacillus alkaliarsenatis TaxID=766136 RepID=A0A1E5G5A6_9FIRM|nr:ADP-forming succinate--CoA ligase subunit beta [Desulfuribacillus alkaliarsenatis]OEF98377.1 succinate--CoA ligase subunit beta [Desulfuribacillus alkaliarsenatis]
MNIHEYQAKELLKAYEIPIPSGKVIFQAEKAIEAIAAIRSNTDNEADLDAYIVKAQIHAGGRGKAGGAKIATSSTQTQEFAKEILGKQLVTQQTGPEGREVRAVLIEEKCVFINEYYVALTLDRDTARVTVVASEEGGVDIEEAADENPKKIFTEIIDPLIGLSEFQARRICFDINIPKQLINDMVKLMLNMYRCYIDNDCLLLEINPLVITNDNKLKALDAKMNFDDNSLYRNQDLLKYRDIYEEDEMEVEASKYDLSYVSLPGNIACMVNGAGLAMATMDIIKYYGGEPANFLDVGGGASEEKVTKAFKIMLSNKKVKGIFVNIFGGIMKCDVIARGIIKAAEEVKVELPLVVKLEGTNVEFGRDILNHSELNITTVASIGEGAKKIVELVRGVDIEYMG